MSFTFNVSDEKCEGTREIKRDTDNSSESTLEDHYVGKIHEAPDFLRDNEYIHSGYRINFNSKWKIFKSLFVIHNEFVNVWSHLLGVIFIIILIVYTSIYIKSHKTDIIEVFDNKWSHLNDDWSYLSHFKNFTIDLGKTFEGGKDFLQEYAGKIKNTTVNYLHKIDGKLFEYKEYLGEKIKYFLLLIFSCFECIQALVKKLAEMKDAFQENFVDLRDKFTNAYEEKFSSLNITKMDFDFANFFEELNENMHIFKEKIIQKVSIVNFSLIQKKWSG